MQQMTNHRPLAELDLLDDFLFNALLAYPEYGRKFCRKFLKILFGREFKNLNIVTQKSYGGRDTGLHRARLDVYIEEGDEVEIDSSNVSTIYDIEPDKNNKRKDIDFIAQRTRFYHAIIDSRSLKSGQSYDKLKKVFVIFICPYDPFGDDRMIYTIRNHCVENPELPYEDGARTIFLYTKGRKGRDNESLSQLLDYMENTTRENAVTEELEAIQEMVDVVKEDAEVTVAYMKGFERDQMFLEEGKELGRRLEQENTLREKNRADTEKNRADTEKNRAVLNAKAGLYYKLNDYKNAYLTLKESNKNRMSDKSQKREQQMIEMQTRFDVNKLELEKSKLANKNKQIALTGTFILLLAAIGWSIYQRTMVKRLKKMHCALMTAHEEVRKQSMKATESEKMKTAFLNSICHEIRTPLNSIAGFSELIFDESLDTATRQEFRQLIQSNSTALASLMDNMLELSQLVSSELPLPVESTDVYGLCVEEMAKLKETLSKPNIECIITGDKDGMTAQTNAFYLSRVIGNLLSNSAKFTESGTITLTCNIDKEKGQLVISVTDTGIGIPADKQEWVFERFTKVDDFKPGTGLGLYICRIIIQRLGGQIRIDTGYTSGCKMVVTLPV